MNRKFLPAVLVSLAIGAVIGAGLFRGFLFHKEVVRSHTEEKKDHGARRILYWRNPMNPAIHSDHFMKDNMGMDYIPVYSKPPESVANSVSVDPRIRQTLGIRVAPVVRRTFSRTIRTAATVTVDGHRIRTVSSRIRGWVRELSVQAPGDVIRKGDRLGRIYSPELTSSEDEFLIALTAVRSNPSSQDDRDLLAAARQRLRLLDVPDSEIGRLEKTGTSRTVIPVIAPYSGIVSSIPTRVGGEVTPDRPLLTLVDLSRVWIDVALYPGMMAWVKPGEAVTFRTSSNPSRIYRGILRFVNPELDERSRTLRGRALVDNPDGFLKPGMYLEATLHPDPRPDVLVIPRESLIRDGQRTFVIREIGQGHFRPVEVMVGAGSAHWVEAVSGLKEGDRVVVSGQFLLDAESQFENISVRMEGARP